MADNLNTIVDFFTRNNFTYTIEKKVGTMAVYSFESNRKDLHLPPCVLFHEAGESIHTLNFINTIPEYFTEPTLEFHQILNRINVQLPFGFLFLVKNEDGFVVSYKNSCTISNQDFSSQTPALERFLTDSFNGLSAGYTAIVDN